jgi:hypothetical protein
MIEGITARFSPRKNEYLSDKARRDREAGEYDPEDWVIDVFDPDNPTDAFLFDDTIDIQLLKGRHDHHAAA